MADELTPTPAASDSSPASVDAGASSAPSTDSAPSDTRAIAAQLLSEGDTPAAPPPADTSSTPPTPAAATSDGEDDAEYQSLLASGSMPVDRHKAVLTNARNKTRAEVEREFQQKYGWADTFDRTRAEQALGLMQALDRNPEQTIRTIAGALGITFTPPAAAPPEPQEPPPPDVELDDGSEFFTAATVQKREQWLMGEMEKKIAAVAQRFDPYVRRQVESDMRQHANAEAGTLLAECRKEWPSFTALEGDIKQLMTANPQITLERAYIQAFAAKGLPAIQQQHDTDRASQLSRKAAASAAPPSAPRAVTPLRDRDRSTTDIAREVLASGRV